MSAGGEFSSRIDAHNLTALREVRRGGA